MIYKMFLAVFYGLTITMKTMYQMVCGIKHKTLVFKKNIFDKT